MLAVWDRERRAHRAVVEDEAEQVRMRSTITVSEANDQETIHQLNALLAEVNQDRDVRLEMIREQNALVDSLTHERNALLAKLEYHDQTIGQLRAELDALRRFAELTRGVLIDLLGSRGFRLIRLLGRWGKVERRIHRALR
jgi:uncharacterized protein YlxP (DUF503 family)